jgi:hypothetical protein
MRRKRFKRIRRNSRSYSKPSFRGANSVLREVKARIGLFDTIMNFFSRMEGGGSDASNR